MELKGSISIYGSCQRGPALSTQPERIIWRSSSPEVSTMRRRNVLKILGLSLLAPGRSHAQQSTQRIGYLGMVAGSMHDQLRSEVLKVARANGRNIEWKSRFAEGGAEPLRAAALELVKDNVDVIIAQGTSATLAAKSVTTRIPIVGVSVTDPEGLGVVDKLARPNANVTGIASRGEDIVPKRVEMLGMLAPVKRLAWFVNPANDGNIRGLEMARATLQDRHITLLRIEVRDSRDVDAALESARRQGMDAMGIPLDGLMTANCKRFADFALAHRIPSVGALREFVQAGGLLSYGQDQGDNARWVAGYVDRILKGAKVQDLPFQRGDKIELCLNAKTAQSMGIAIPRELLARADFVLE
jgi:putative ABC transport system substrate-binding protein